MRYDVETTLEYGEKASNSPGCCPAIWKVTFLLDAPCLHKYATHG